MTQSPASQTQRHRRSAGVVKERRSPSTKRRESRGQQERSRHDSTFVVAAVTLAVGNFVTLILLSWSDAAVFGRINPAIWLVLGSIFPIALTSVSVYRSYWKAVGQADPEIERLGPYVLKEKLGAGGMGEVYLAEHRLMKRQCAIKLIHPERASEQGVQDSFAREAKATAQLTHWNTIEVYDYGTTDDGRFYYVMEFLEGVNLWEYVDKYGAMDAGRVIYVLKQLCDALYEAECAGLVHRDIKPSNIFLTVRGRSFDVAKLLDFGLVHAAADQPLKSEGASSTLHGSPAFMCPEQAVGLAPDCRGDLYSLGAVAYFLLTGRPPFENDNPIMLIVAHATMSVPTFDEIGANVPGPIGDIILKCLARDPSDRYSSARELLDALDACPCDVSWTRRDAEQWWHEYSPRAAGPTETATLKMCDTQRHVRSEHVRDPEKTVLNHEVPTDLYELQCDAEVVAEASV